MRGSPVTAIPAAAAALAFVLLAAALAGADGPSSSLLGDPNRRRPLTLEQHSWTSGTYQVPQEVKQIKLYDLITVIVDGCCIGLGYYCCGGGEIQHLSQGVVYLESHRV